MMAPAECTNPIFKDPAPIVRYIKSLDSFDNKRKYSFQFIKGTKFKKIDSMLESLSNGTYTNEDIIELPNASAITGSQMILEIFKRKNSLPENLAPTIDGGILVEFFVGSNYNCIEFYNSGTIVLLEESTDKPTLVGEVKKDFLKDYLNNILDGEYVTM
jgi:hypothetical protein